MENYLGTRIGDLLESNGRNMSELAEFCGVTPQAVQQWVKGVTTPRGKKMSQIAEFFGITAPELMFGPPSKGPHDKNIELMPSDAAPVPVISYVQAGHWNEAVDPYNVGEAEEWLPCPVKHGPRTFALKVRGESMYNPNGHPSFVEGDIIFCDPDVEARHRSLVIVRLEGSKEATFKRLLVDSDQRYLEALNPDWPNRIFEVTEEATISGVVIARLESLL